MAKGPKITEDVRRIIAEVYIENHDWRAKEIQDEVNKRLRGKGPGLSAIQKLLTKLRKSNEEAAKSLEAPWSLGASAEYNIPPEANQDLMRIWKWCTVVGLMLTIREAQWVARLRGIVPFEVLYACAVHYARRGQVHQLLGQTEMFTSDLDSHIAFRYGSLEFLAEPKDVWLAHTSSITGAVRLFTPDSFKESDYNLDLWEKEYFAEMNVSTGQRVEEYLSLELHHRQKLSENADMVYSLWLRRFRGGSKWQSSSQETREEIAQCLYKEVAVVDKEIQALIESCRKSENINDLILLHKRLLEWIPSKELLEKVGISQIEEGSMATYESERGGRRRPFTFKQLNIEK